MRFQVADILWLTMVICVFFGTYARGLSSGAKQGREEAKKELAEAEADYRSAYQTVTGLIDAAEQRDKRAAEWVNMWHRRVLWNWRPRRLTVDRSTGSVSYPMDANDETNEILAKYKNI